MPNKQEGVRPPTHIEIVKQFGDKTAQHIAKETGLTRKQVWVAQYKARKGVRLTHEELSKRASESQLDKSDSIRRLVQPYENVGLIPIEIVEGIQLITGELLDRKRVSKITKNIRKVERRQKAKFTSEELAEISRDMNKPKDAIRERVGIWLDTAAYLVESTDDSLPVERVDWKQAIVDVHNKGIIVDSKGPRWKRLVELHKERGLHLKLTPDVLPQVREFLREIRRQEGEATEHDMLIAQVRTFAGRNTGLPQDEHLLQVLAQIGDKLFPLRNNEQLSLVVNPFIQTGPDDDWVDLLNQLKPQIQAMKQYLQVSDTAFRALLLSLRQKTE